MHTRTITALFYYYVHIYNNIITIIYKRSIYNLFPNQFLVDTVHNT